MPSFQVRIDEETEIRLDYEDSQVVQVNRCDFVNKVGTVKRTDEGYLRGDAAVAKVGIMSYLLPDGSICRELVPPETLFNADGMKTLHLQPITNSHPKEIMLDAKTTKRRKVGSTGESVRQDGEYLVSSIVITDSDAIESVESGRQQLSPGYKAALVKQSGVFRGQKFDAVQIKRTYNHVAICDRARGGADLKLNLDTIEVEKLDGYELNDEKIDFNPKVKERHMPTFKIDGIDYDAAQEVINYVSRLQSKTDELETKIAKQDENLKTLRENLDSVTAERDTQKDKIDELEKVDHSEAIEAGIKERIAVLDVAKSVLDTEAVKKLDGMSNEEIKRAVILAKSPKAKLDEQSENYISARYDAIVENINFDGDAIRRQRYASGKRHDSTGNIDPVEKAKADSEDRIKNAYKELDSRFK